MALFCANSTLCRKVTCTFLLLLLSFIGWQAYQIKDLFNLPFHNVRETSHRTSPILCPPANVRIPEIIHVIWRTKNVSEYRLKPSTFEWASLYPEHTILVWSEDEVRELLRTKYSYLYPLYLSYPYDIQRADVARYVVLHSEGGIYSDLDSYPHRKGYFLNDFCSAQFVAPETSDMTSLSNFFLMAEKESPLLDYVLHQLESHNHDSIMLPYLYVFTSTGPLFLTQCVLEWMRDHKDYDLVILEEPQIRSKYVYHKAGRSWHRFDAKVINYFGDNFGKVVYRNLIWQFLIILFGGCALLFFCRYFRRRVRKP